MNRKRHRRLTLRRGVALAARAASAIIAVTACGSGDLVVQEHPQHQIVGRLAVGKVDDTRCDWVVDDQTGIRWTVFWPDGWDVIGRPPQLMDGSHRVVADSEDVIQIGGPADGIGASICGDKVFLASSVMVLTNGHSHFPAESS